MKPRYGKLTLDDADPLVTAALEAETRLYAHYRLEARTRHVRLPEPDLRVRVTEIGSGPPLLVVPGNTGDAFTLASLMKQLPGRRLIAVNRPGGGLSDGMDHRTVDLRPFAVGTLVTVLDALGLDKVDVLAHSLGAHWSFWLAMDRPERVRRMVLLGNPGKVLNGGPPWTLRVLTRPPFIWLLGRMIVPRVRAQSLRSLKMLGHDAATIAALPESFRDCYFEFRRLPHYRISLLSLLANAPRSITASELANVTQPVALLWGTRDTFGGTNIGQAIADALPKGELHPLKGAGHLPWLEQAEACGRIALEFLQRPR